MKNLERVEASQEWLKQARSFLVNKVNQDTFAHKTSWNYNIKVWFIGWQDKLVPSPVKAVSFLLLIGLVSATGLAARAEFNPSKFLYSVWETVERAELVLATSPTSQTKVYLKHVEKTVKDAQKLAQSEKLDDQERNKHINTVVTKLKKEMSAASASLDIAEQTKAGGNITELAKEVTSNTQNTVDALNKVIEESEMKGADKAAVNEAIAATEAVQGEAIQLLINQPDLQNLSAEELANLVVEKIARATEQLNKILDYFNQSRAITPQTSSVVTTTAEIIDNLAEESTETAGGQVQVTSENQAVLTAEKQEALNQSAVQFQDYLDLASDALAEGNLTEALKNVSNVTQLIIQANEILGETLDESLPAEGNQANQDNQSNSIKVEGVMEILPMETTTTTETTATIIQNNQADGQNSDLINE